MPTKRYVVTLTATERDQLDALTRARKRSARTIPRARILLLADQSDGGPGWEDRRVAETLGCGHRTVERVRERFVTDGLNAALIHKPQAKPSREPVLDGAAEARLIALACEEAPSGRKRWTLRMLADKLVELEVVEAIDPKQRLHDTINSLNRNQRVSLPRFFGDGSGQAICWEPAGATARSKAAVALAAGA